MQNLLSNVEVLEINAPVSAGSSIDDNSDIVDTDDCEGVLFVVPIEDSVDTGVATLTIEQNSANSDSGMAALAGAVATATSAANDDLNGTVLMVDIYRPRDRYIQGVLSSTTADIAYGTMIAIKYGRRVHPVSQGATVSASTVVASPAES